MQVRPPALAAFMISGLTCGSPGPSSWEACSRTDARGSVACLMPTVQQAAGWVRSTATAKRELACAVSCAADATASLALRRIALRGQEAATLGAFRGGASVARRQGKGMELHVLAGPWSRMQAALFINTSQTHISATFCMRLGCIIPGRPVAACRIEGLERSCMRCMHGSAWVSDGVRQQQGQSTDQPMQGRHGAARTVTIMPRPMPCRHAGRGGQGRRGVLRLVWLGHAACADEGCPGLHRQPAASPARKNPVQLEQANQFNQPKPKLAIMLII